MAENPPAFPVVEQRDDYGNSLIEGSYGMSLRDWFAGQALSGLLAGIYADGSVLKVDGDPQKLSVAAFAFADAMLAEREKSS